MPGEKIVQLGLERQRGFLAYVDARGSLLAVKLGGSAEERTPRLLIENAVKREDGFVYYLDEDGDIARAVVSMGTAAASKTSKAKAAAKSSKQSKKKK